ncbi:tripartite tricarboxylate transporter TctB family protein [Salinicola peritrichatus]|uniref:tripartite tricarboxylate transporter TctB family protein n=1 Tax=Salinicola peritrichatus TaxID=1267424 RepID=UPI000DA1103E|nr:tripartite tricarboxylate transporter TctB family protein [Salinicola peritrichatus]
MNISRLLLGLFGIAVAGVFFFDASNYPRAAAQMPMIYSVAVALLSAAMIGDELVLKRRRAIAGGQSRGKEMAAAPAEPKRWLAVAAIFALAMGYVALMTTLGYIVATALFMAAALAILRTVGWRFALIAGAVLIAVVCLVFVQFLGLPIPLLPSFL